MTTTSAILGFATASFAIALSPGPSWIYVISTTAGEGRRAGWLAVAGNGTGILCHVLAASLGITALLEVSSVGYQFLRFAGAFYLIYLGVRMLFAKPKATATAASTAPRSRAAIFRAGLLVNVLNPKMALLMLALLPQFIDPARGSTVLQTLAIGGMHVAIASAVLSTLVVLTARVLTAEDGRSPIPRRLSQALRAVGGSVLVAWGVRMAWGGVR